MNDELKNDIDRTIPEGTKYINDEGKQTVFKDGEFVLEVEKAE
jgi:hypothetical protein